MSVKTAPAAQLSLRIDETNPNHHLWNNHGTWFLHYTLHEGCTAVRVRRSLRTRNLQKARKLRDEFFARMVQREVSA